MTDSEKVLVAMYSFYLAGAPFTDFEEAGLGLTTLSEEGMAQAHALVNSDAEAADLFERVYGEACGD